MPSQPSAKIHIDDGYQIELSGIEAYSPWSTSETDLMYRKVYRQQMLDADDSTDFGDYLFLQRIDDNETLTYIDNTASIDLGETFPYDYAVPPWGNDLCFHQDRLWAARLTQTSESYDRGYAEDPYAPYTKGLSNLVMYTPVGQAVYWPVDNQFRVGDAAPVVGLCSWRNHLFIFKTNGVWVLTGYSDSLSDTSGGSFTLEWLDAHGLCAYRAYSASNHGVMWASQEGVMFFDGSKVMMLASYVDGQLTRPTFADGERPKMCVSNGKHYLLSGDDLWWVDPEAGVWGCETCGDIGYAGIQGFALGDHQAHVLTTREWNDTTSDTEEITVLHTGADLTNYASAGSSVGNLRRNIDLVFAPLVGEPDELWVGQNAWFDGSWTGTLTLAWSTDNTTWTDIATVDPDFRAVALPPDVQGPVVYLRLYGEAEDFALHSVKLYAKKSGRVASA